MTAQAELAQKARHAATQIRRLRRSGGRTAATIKAIDRHRSELARAIAGLMDGHTVLVGLLTEEDRLARRIDDRKAADAGYEDLAARLVTCRQRIRGVLADSEVPS